MEYYIIRKKYLAEAIAYLGFRYYKECEGRDTIYKFNDTIEFRQALTELMQLKKRVGQYLE